MKLLTVFLLSIAALLMALPSAGATGAELFEWRINDDHDISRFPCAPGKDYVLKVEFSDYPVPPEYTGVLSHRHPIKSQLAARVVNVYDVNDNKIFSKKFWSNEWLPALGNPEIKFMDVRIPEAVAVNAEYLDLIVRGTHVSVTDPPDSGNLETSKACRTPLP